MDVIGGVSQKEAEVFDYPEWWWFMVGVLAGWVTKIPIFLRMYREWERQDKSTREAIRRLMEKEGSESK